MVYREDSQVSRRLVISDPYNKEGVLFFKGIA